MLYGYRVLTQKVDQSLVLHLILVLAHLKHHVLVFLGFLCLNFLSLWLSRRLGRSGRLFRDGRLRFLLLVLVHIRNLVAVAQPVVKVVTELLENVHVVLASRAFDDLLCGGFLLLIASAAEHTPTKGLRRCHVLLIRRVLNGQVNRFGVELSCDPLFPHFKVLFGDPVVHGSLLIMEVAVLLIIETVRVLPALLMVLPYLLLFHLG